MDDMMYKHVLFKDLHNYIKRTDYFSGYTPTEKAWIRKNLDLVGEKELSLLFNEALVITEEQLNKLIKEETLKIGLLYITPYLDKYKLVQMARSSTEFFANVIILTDNPNSLLWDVKYQNGKVVYLKDENGNEANFDFKHLKVNDRYTFLDSLGKENSSECKGNNLTQCTNVTFTGISNNNFIQGENVHFEIPVSNLIGKANNVTISLDEIDLSNDLLKQFITFNNNLYIDYLDLETLTHLFYAIDIIS